VGIFESYIYTLVPWITTENLTEKKDRREKMRKKSKSRMALTTTFSVILIFSVVTAALGIGPVVASTPTHPARTITPLEVAPGGEVTVVIDLVVQSDDLIYAVKDVVPVGWTVVDWAASQEPLATSFDATDGSVVFAWVYVDEDDEINLEYTLHVPGDTVQGVYPISGDVKGTTLTGEEWSYPIPEGEVEVKMAGPDVEPPEISNVASSAITQTTATITWNTNEPADSRVRYGTTSGGPYDEAYDDTDVTSHSMGLTGLTENTTYYYKVRSTDPSGNSAESAEYSFKTLAPVPDEEPPVISNVASSAAETRATITWDTDEPADSRVKYGTTSGGSYDEEYDATDVTSHSVDLTGLSANTTYYYVVNSTDPSGNAAESDEYSIKTLEEGAIPRWDINEDGVVDDLDLGLLLLHYGDTTSPPYPRWDINKDEVVDDLDLGLLLLHYGEGE
jgi:chitodextrinase